jgi:hypothetical protein
VTRRRETQDTCRILVRKLLGKRKDNIKMDLRDTGCEDRRWMEVAEDRVQQPARHNVNYIKMLLTTFGSHAPYFSVFES